MERKSLSGILLRLFLIVMLSVVFCSVIAEAQLKTVKASSDDGEIRSASGDSWVWVKDTITGAWGEAVVGTGDAIYIARKSSFYRYHPSDNSWTVLAAPPNPDTGDAFKTGTALAWDFGDYIYALYGAATADSRRWFYRYSISGNSWEALANTTYDQGEADAITWVGLDNCIYATIGGEQRLTYFLRYDPSTNTWSDAEVTDPPAGMGDGASLVWTGGELLYALRGEFYEESPTYDFWRYNITSDTWTVMADIPAYPHDSGVGGVGDGGSLIYIGLWLSNQTDFIYALSGNQAYPESPSPVPDRRFYRYTISTNSWERLADLLFSVGYYVGNRLGYAGGHIYAWQGTPSTWTGGGDDLAQYKFAPLPKTWTVDDDGPADFSKIQDAINAAHAGDTIYVYNGTYYENIVVNKTLSLVGENIENTIIDARGIGDVLRIEADYVTVSNFTLQYGDNGIYLSGSHRNTIRNNNITKNRYNGITGEYSTDNNFDGNVIKSNHYGIDLHALCEGNTIENNTVINNGIGIYLRADDGNNTIQGNIIQNNSFGIDVGFSNDNWIIDNIITNNIEYGIYMVSSVGNDVYNNFIANNTVAGIYFDGGNDNKVYHNNFIDNADQVRISVSFNSWDDGYPSGGNYWSDYTGVDLYNGPNQDIAGSDGIGDTPYVIDENNRDNYPLMKPWSAVIDKTLPNITIVLPIDGSTFVSSINLKAIISDEAGVDVAWWAVEGIMIGAYFFHGIENGTYESSISGLKNSSLISSAYYVWDNGTIIKGEPNQFNVTIVNGQRYYVAVFANDTSGNIASSKVYVTKMPGDTTPPLTVISLSGMLGKNDWFTSDITVTLSATDDTEVDKTEYSFDNSTWITYVAPFTIHNEGITIIYYKSTDKAGHSETIKTKTIKIDKTIPLGFITINDGATYTNSSSVTLTLSADDVTSGVAQMRFSHDNTTWTAWEPYSTSKVWTLPAGDGTKTVYVQYMDNAGLVSQSYSDEITLDTAPPSITITSPNLGYEIQSSKITVSWTGSDGTSGISHYEIKLDDSSWINVGTNTTHTFTELTDGSHTIEVRAIDKAGLANQDSVSFIVNTSPLLGPGYTEEAAILAATIIAAIGFIFYFLRIRKR